MHSRARKESGAGAELGGEKTGSEREGGQREGPGAQGGDWLSL